MRNPYFQLTPCELCYADGGQHYHMYNGLPEEEKLTYTVVTNRQCALQSMVNKSVTLFKGHSKRCKMYHKYSAKKRCIARIFR